MVALTVHVSPPAAVDDLVAAFRDSGCLAHRSGPRTCSVVHSAAADDREARIEIAFFLRAWQARNHVVRALLAP